MDVIARESVFDFTTRPDVSRFDEYMAKALGEAGRGEEEVGSPPERSLQRGLVYAVLALAVAVRERGGE